MKKIFLTMLTSLFWMIVTNAQPIHIPSTGVSPMLSSDGVQVDREWFIVDDAGNVSEAAVRFEPNWNTEGNGSRWITSRQAVTPGTYVRFRAFFYIPKTYDLSTIYYTGRIMFNQSASLKINNHYVSQLACGDCGFRDWLVLATGRYFWPDTSSFRHGLNEIEVLVENFYGSGFGLRIEDNEPQVLDRTLRSNRSEFDDGEPDPDGVIIRYFTILVPELAESECIEKTISFPEASSKYSMSAQMVDGAYRRSVGARFTRGSVQLTICAPNGIALPSEAFTIKVTATPIRSRRRSVGSR